VTVLRPYQLAACDECESRDTPTCLVLPTGGGKTVVAEELIRRALERSQRVLFIVHRRELVKQTAKRFRTAFGPLQVGTIGGGENPSPYSPIQVAMIQTLVEREPERRPQADLIIWDECHHALADDWGGILDSYEHAHLVGLTATPQRLDGKPLGDVFRDLVVAATYPELLKDGHLVQCRAYQPPEVPGNGLAQEPLKAWQRYAENSQTFAFASDVQGAHAHAAAFNAAGIPSAVIEAKTPAAERDDHLRRFAHGQLRVLWNVYVLTEGTDIPAARCVLLARSVNHVSMFLQMCGRVLRPHESKRDAILIDLTGATLIHGMPLEERAYSLDGKGIQRTSLAPLRNCMQCGATILSAYDVCPECGFVFPKQARSGPRIFDMELRAVYAGEATPLDAQRREFDRLVKLAEDNGWSFWTVCKRFKHLFGRNPSTELRALPVARQQQIFGSLQHGIPIQRARGTWKALTGSWPGWRWRCECKACAPELHREATG
jgi:DNA repair protein RadD